MVRRANLGVVFYPCILKVMPYILKMFTKDW